MQGDFHQDDLKIRSYELGKDYPDLCEWWRARKWKAVPTHALGQGIVCEDRNIKHAAIFYYFAEGPWAFVDFLVTNPDGPLRMKAKSIDLIVSAAVKNICAVKMAIGFESPLIMNVTGNKNLIEIFQKNGFKIGDQKMTTLIWGQA